MSDEIETIDKNPKSWAAWKREAERLQAIIDDMVLAAMDSETAIADCDPEVYEKGVSVCLVAIPKETAEVICQNITAATGCKVDWHYFGGRVHIKALRESSQPAPVVQCPFPCGWDNLNKLAIQDAALVARGLVEGELITEAHRQAAISNNDRLLKVISACRAAMFAAARQSPGSEPAIVPGKWIPVSERIPDNTEPVLCIEKRADFGTYGQPFVCWHDGGGWVGKTNYRPIVTHWMPLPAGPQEVR